MKQNLSFRQFAPLTVCTTIVIVVACDPAGITRGAARSQSVAADSGFASGSPQQAILNADTTRPNNSTFVIGEKVGLTFQASRLQPSKIMPLSIKVSDELGNLITSSSISLATDTSGSASATFSAPASKFGYYRVDATLPDGTTISGLGSRPAGYITYAVVPDPNKRVNYGDSGSRFGMQGGFSAAQGSVIPYLGIRYILAGPGWSDLESRNAGQFAIDRQAALAKGQVYPAKSPVTSAISYNGAPWQTFGVPLVTTAKVPGWALEPGTSGSICKNMGALNAAGVEALPAFAQALAEAATVNFANQSARYYEVTWEPAKWCFGGTPQQLVQIHQLSYGPIHRADPKAIVMGPTLFPENSALLSDLWAAGLANYIDAVSMHPYAKWPPETNGLINDVRTQMEMARNAKGHSMPFVGTEHGYTSSTIGELNEAFGDVRSTLILLGEGFKFDFAFYIADSWSKFGDTSNYYGYYWNLNPKISYGTDKMAPKPVVPAYAAMTFLLDGTTAIGPLTTLTGTQLGYRFHRGDTSILALWDYQAHSSTVNLPVPSGSIQICNWMGNCNTTTGSGGSITLELGSAPTYVIGRTL